MNGHPQAWYKTVGHVSRTWYGNGYRITNVYAKQMLCRANGACLNDDGVSWGGPSWAMYFYVLVKQVAVPMSSRPEWTQGFSVAPQKLPISARPNSACITLPPPPEPGCDFFSKCFYKDPKKWLKDNRGALVAGAQIISAAACATGVGCILTAVISVGLAVANRTYDFVANKAYNDGALAAGGFILGLGLDVLGGIPGAGSAKAAVGALKAEENIVYRAIRAGEDPSKGLFAKGSGDTQPWQHVFLGPSESPWISTTRDPKIVEKYLKTGSGGVVRIDLSKVSGEVVHADRGMHVPSMYDDMYEISEQAWQDKEVLIKHFVPADAITHFWPM